ncbi:TPA: hypothetical protein I9Y37_001914 [Citrobacter freundii]|nr:hypothetical protein [Citrobacter freundii]HAT3963889.1 hypothetical protein [Citrobacter freundii]
MFWNKYHFFYLAYADKNGFPVGVAIRTKKPYVTDKSLQFGRVQCELEPTAPVLAVSYMGRMTLKQWNSPQ